MTLPIYSFISQIGIDSANPVTRRFDFRSCSISANEEYLDTTGLRGSRSRMVERNRGGIRHIGGHIRMQPTTLEWTYLMPWILGAAASGNTYALADVLPYRFITVDKSNGVDGKVWTYDHCLVNRATIRGTQGQPIDLELDIIGVDETSGNAGTFPVLTIDVTTFPLVFMDLVISINAVTVHPKEVEITIDNRLDGDRFFNSATLSASFNAMDRHIGLRTRLPYGDATALYGTGTGGVAADATFTNGGASLDFSFVKVVFPKKPIDVPERQEVMLPMEGTALQSGSTKELVVTLVAGP